jgi:predicted glycogen debranching enzyme
MPAIMLSFDEGEWSGEGNWYFQTVYPRETERGLDDREDLYCPGVLRVPLRQGASTVIACGTRPARVASAHGWVTAELLRRGAAAQRGRDAAGDCPQTELGAWLGIAADAFVVQGDGAPAVIAGYPWFGEWARDTAIALPGLCLATGRVREAGALLHRLAETIEDGLLPNRMPDRGGRPAPDDYNAVDAPLLFIEAAARASEAGMDVGALLPAIASILGAYEDGTRFGIGLRSDGLVHQGQPGIALTWMDARVDGIPVTPRTGAAVEVNALWYNALLRGAGLIDSRSRARHWHRLAERCREGFEAFWHASGGYLYDRLAPEGPDPALRPNQLFAVCLAFSPLDAERKRAVVDVVERELLVPGGVRTLSSHHVEYRGSFTGPLRELDHAYHSGTAWPWLLGPFGHALLAAHGTGAETIERVRAIVAGVERDLVTYGLGQVAEVLSADPPHAPGGCIAQAWSCAEMLRLLATLRDASPSSG